MQVFKDEATGRVTFGMVSADDAAAQKKQFDGLDSTVIMVFQYLCDSKDRGIWIRHLRHRTNLPAARLSKILKELEKRRLIKGVKSITSRTKALYLQYAVITSREHLIV